MLFLGNRVIEIAEVLLQTHYEIVGTPLIVFYLSLPYNSQGFPSPLYILIKFVPSRDFAVII